MIAATAPTAAACRTPDAKSAPANPAAFRFSAAQVQQGRALYVQQQCAICHGENLRGSPGAPALADADFRGAWRGRPVQALVECTRSTMPPGRTGALSDAEYQSLVSMILDANGYDPGSGRAMAWR
jgi:mono/diheme cytochrome c family protein